MQQAQIYSVKQAQEAIKKRQEEREVLEYFGKMLEEEKSKKAAMLTPSLPLEEREPIDVDKTSTISFTLKVRPGGNNEHTYKKTLRLFHEGSPFDWLLTMRDLREVWTQNSINGLTDRAAIVRAVLRDDALAQFATSLEAQRKEAADNQLTVEMVEAALSAVSASVFPHRALENQKLWMRRHMKKPVGMSFRSLQAKVVQINQYLPAFPEASEEDKFGESELLGILEYALPSHWRQKFDLDGYVPTEHDRARLLRECEAMERNEPGELAKRVPKKKKTKKEKKHSSLTKSQKGKFCSEHGWGTHSSSECWTLHPELMPEKFKINAGGSAKTKKPNKAEKETHSLVKEAVKDQLQELLATMQTSKKRKAPNGVCEEIKIVTSSDARDKCSVRV